MKKRIFSILILLMCIVPIYSVFGFDDGIGDAVEKNNFNGKTVSSQIEYIYCEYNLTSSGIGKPLSFNNLDYYLAVNTSPNYVYLANTKDNDAKLEPGLYKDNDSITSLSVKVKEVWSDGDFAYKKVSGSIASGDQIIFSGDYNKEGASKPKCPKYAIVKYDGETYLFYDKSDYDKKISELNSNSLNYAYATDYIHSRALLKPNSTENGCEYKDDDDDNSQLDYQLDHCYIGTDNAKYFKNVADETQSGVVVNPDQNPKVGKVGSASNVQPGVQKACSSLSASTCSSDPRCTVDGGSCVADEEFIGDGFCYNGNVLRSIRIIGYLLALVKLFVPLIIVGFSIMEFYKSVVNVDKDNVAKQARKVLIRVLIGMSIFFIPGLVHGILQAFYNHDFKNNSILQCESCLLKPFECDVNKFSTSNSGKTTDNDSSSSSETEVNCSSLALDSCSSTSTCTWNGSSCVKK